jgi:hypothetical protein
MDKLDRPFDVLRHALTSATSRTRRATAAVTASTLEEARTLMARLEARGRRGRSTSCP